MNLKEVFIGIFINLGIAGWVILVLILSLTILAFFKKENRGTLQAVVVSLGIFGTFLGIIVALCNFNTEKIDESIPALIGGLKFAFSTSIFGLFFSIVIHFFSVFTKNKTGKKKEFSEKEILAKTLEEIKILNKNISGEGDASCASPRT